jgi:peptidyl-prolyl cis-trans isomerase D
MGFLGFGMNLQTIKTGANSMLKQLRHKKTAKKIWITLAVIIVPAFVFWGFGSALRSSKDSYAGKINGKVISTLRFQEALEATKNQAIIQFGDKFTEVQKYLDFNGQAWERLIMLDEAKRRGISVSDKEVEELIASYPFFQKNGKFDSAVYQEMLQYVFRTPARTFEEETRENISLGKLFTQVTDNMTLSDADIRQEYRKATEGISASFISAVPPDFAKDINPQENDLREYFQKNNIQFKQPLSFNIEYIQADSEKKIMDAAKLLSKNGDLNKTAKDLGLTVKSTGIFAQNEPIPGIGWSPEILELISNLKIAGSSSPIHLDNSYYILKLKERKEAYIPEFDKIKNKVREAYIKEESEKIAKSKIEECLKKIKADYGQNPKGLDFVKIAKSYQLKSGGTQVFKFGSYIEGIGSSDALWLGAQDLKTDEVSDIISIPSGLYILKLKTRTAFDEKKFQSDKENFTQKLLQQKKQDYFVKYTEELKKKAQPK